MGRKRKNIELKEGPKEEEIEQEEKTYSSLPPRCYFSDLSGSTRRGYSNQTNMGSTRGGYSNRNNMDKNEADAAEHQRLDISDSFPSGYRFMPTDYELIVDYLMKKIKNVDVPPNNFLILNLYDYHPRHLFDIYEPKRENELYIFTKRQKKYENGERPNRVTSTGEGTWRASQKDKPVLDSRGKKVGEKRSLVYQEFSTTSAKDDPKQTTNWLMQEYSIGKNLDQWVLCKIYKGRMNKKDKTNATTYNVVPIHDVNYNGSKSSSEMLIEDIGFSAFHAMADHPISTVAPPDHDRANHVLMLPPATTGDFYATTDTGPMLPPLPPSIGFNDIDQNYQWFNCMDQSYHGEVQVGDGGVLNNDLPIWSNNGAYDHSLTYPKPDAFPNH